MRFPEELFYTKNHEWILFKEEYALVGITGFAQRELGNIINLDIAALHKMMERGEMFGTVEAVKIVSDLFMPVTGKIVEINHLISDTPELINTDPYGDGWLIKIAILHEKERQYLLSADDYKMLIYS